MKSSTPQNEPKLQPPGAGIPFLHRIILSTFVVPLISKRTPPEQSRRNYEKLVQKLIEKISAVPAELRNQKVLVKPMRGLEDSSRYWSLNGVMEHLIIVSQGIEGGILSLASGKVPDRKADTAAVKPKHPDRDYLEEFRTYAPTLMQRIDEQLNKPGMNFDSPLKFSHPWFGPLTAKQWYWLLPTHEGIHYTQVKEILKGLKQ